MAIKIPSEKIYEIENPKVRDNLIDNIEVKCFSSTPTYYVKTNVSEQKYNIKGVTLTHRSQDDKDFKYIQMGGGTYDNNFDAEPYLETLAYVRIQASYLVGWAFSVDKNQHDSYIIKLYNLLDENGSSNIKFQTTCLKYNGTCSYPVEFVRDYVNGEYDAIIGAPTRNYGGSVGYEPMPYPPNGTITKSDSISYKDSFGHPAGAERTSIATLTFDDSLKEDGIYTNLGEIKLTDYGDRIGFNFTVMASCTIDTISNSYKIIEGVPVGENKTITGTSVYYAPESVSITVEGDKKGISFKEITIPIPSAKGNNPFKIEGSELLQETNFIGSEDTNALTKHYTDLISQYANGKETAIIRCAIGDYYDTNNVKQISVYLKNYVQFNSAHANSFYGVSVIYNDDGTVTLNGKTAYTNTSSRAFLNLGTFDMPAGEYYFRGFPNSAPSQTGMRVEYYYDNKLKNRELQANQVLAFTLKESQKVTLYIAIPANAEYHNVKFSPMVWRRDYGGSQNFEKNNPMTFDIYDEVIPMVYTNDGDVPMSKYPDGSPKIFKVLGVVPDYRGAVFQKLYLQEI